MEFNIVEKTNVLIPEFGIIINVYVKKGIEKFTGQKNARNVNRHYNLIIVKLRIFLKKRIGTLSVFSFR